MKHQLTSYLKFLLQSTNAHGVHSPFVYDLVTQCFYDKTEHPAYKTLREYNQVLKSNTETIAVTDFGQGSRVFKSNERKVSAIAKYAGISAKRQQLLYRLSRYLKPDHMLELGTSLGMATSAVALGNPNGTITTLEGCPNTAEKASEAFKKFQLENVQLLVQPFATYFDNAQKTSKKLELVFIDGNHNKESTLEYFEELIPLASENSIFIFDDIYWSAEMTQAWEKISKHPEVTVSIDTYHWGLIFFRKTQPKQHFKIRV